MNYGQKKNIVLEMLQAGEKVNELNMYMKNILSLKKIIQDLRDEGYIIYSKPFLGKDGVTWFHNYKLKEGKQELLFQ